MFVPIGVSFLFPAVPILAMLGMVMMLLILPGFLGTRNVGILSYITFIFFLNLKLFVEAFLFRNTVEIKAPIYCDISTVFIMVANLGIPGASLCICRFTWLVTRQSPVRAIHDQRRKTLIIDTTLSILVPILGGGLGLLTSVYRFSVFEDFGCAKGLVGPAAFFLHRLPPLVFSLIGTIYCGLAIWNLVQNRKKVNEGLEKYQGTTPGRFVRLLLLSISAVIAVNAMNIWFVWDWFASGLNPDISWSERKETFNHILYVPRLLMDMDKPTRDAVLTLAFVPIGLAIHFFLFFGFGTEAMREHRRRGSAVLRVLRRIPWLKRSFGRTTRHSDSFQICDYTESDDVTPYWDDVKGALDSGEFDSSATIGTYPWFDPKKYSASTLVLPIVLPLPPRAVVRNGKSSWEGFP